MNKILKAALCLGLVTMLGTSNTFAQDKHKDHNDGKMAERKEMHEKKFAEASKRLNLTADQQEKIKAVMVQNKTEMKVLREANKDKTKEEKRAAMIGQLKKLDGQITAVLDAKQLATYKQMKAEKKSEMKKKREEKAEMDEYLGVF
jgi:protein CpxP